MSKILIVFAQLGEARAFLEHTRAEAVSGETAHIWSEGELPCRYAFDKGWIVISGVGQHHGQMAAAKYGHLCDEVWNLGFAGALKEGLAIGEFMTIETIGKHIHLEETFLDTRSQECLSFSTPNFSLSDPGGKLISSDFPIHNLQHRQQLATKWDLVDMEAYGIAFAAAALNKKCRIWKIVSDFASPGGRELIHKHRTSLSEKIAQKNL